MSISVFWWVVAALVVFFALRLIWRNLFAEQSVIKEPVQRPLPSNTDPKVTPIENRKIADTKGYIPLENLVISEIPINKAESIGHFTAQKRKGIEKRPAKK